MKVSGIITDVTTKEFVPFAVVYQSDKDGKLIAGKNTTADENGKYSLDIVKENIFCVKEPCPQPKQYLTARIVGKKQQTKEIPFLGALNFELQPSSETVLNEYVVESTKSLKKNKYKIAGGGFLLAGIISIITGFKS